ncbi:MAG: leucyl aminopeptidase family protein [Candidatus Liptonbacteria bacterium]
MKINVSAKPPTGFVAVVFKGGKSSYRQTSPTGEELVIGVENPNEINRRKFITLSRRIARLAKEHRLNKLVIRIDSLRFPKLRLDPKELTETLVQNLELADFEFVNYKTAPKEGWPFLGEVALIHKKPAALRKAAERGQIIGREINLARTLSNTPGDDMTPVILAEKAKEAAKGLPIKVTVLDKKEMERVGLRAVLAVGRGATAEPKFIIMEYAARKESPIVLVGKGITFDTGGINLKPGEGLREMHLDMSGGAAVIHSLALAAKLKLKRHLIGIIPAAENAISGSSLFPGDIIRPLAGPSIEVKDTDAEGRLILADGLAYAARFKPQLVVDVATLTGASVVALGEKASAIMTRQEKLEKDVRRWGEEGGDYVWPLPLWDEYLDYIKSDFADIANVGKKEKCGDAVNGGMFLYQYAKDYPWLHIDMAPTMSPSDTDELAKGATGSPIRLLLKIMEKYH